MKALTCDRYVERFWGKVEAGGEDECWLWTAGKSDRGYGQFWDGERKVRVHRFAYELLVGPIPTGMELDHLCRVLHCVNPKHLEPVVHCENVLRGNGTAAENARKTHCKNGHEFTPENTYLGLERGRERRRCRTCDRRRNTLVRERVS